MSLAVGSLIIFERTFTKKDVEMFREISKDEAAHHVTPDEHGRLFVHGLLTGTLPTKIGGDYNVLARKMNFEFLRPVFTGDTIRCEVEITHFEETSKRSHLDASFKCKNQNEKEVVLGTFAGVILH